VHEVQLDALDVGVEVRQPIERPFLSTPIEAVTPVVDELAQEA
jgi:hypothetical protein